MRPSFSFVPFCLLFLASAVHAQEPSPTCDHLMRATVEQMELAVSTVEGADHHQISAELRASEEPDVYIGVNRYYDATGELLRSKETRLLCDGDFLLIEGSVTTAPDGTELFHMVHEPPTPLLQFPLVDGATWTWSGVYNMMREGSVSRLLTRQRATVHPVEAIETPAGTFEAQRLVYTVTIVMDGESHDMTHESWVVLDPFYIEPRQVTVRPDGVTTTNTLSELRLREPSEAAIQ